MSGSVAKRHRVHEERMGRCSMRVALMVMLWSSALRAAEPWEDPEVFELGRLPARAQTWPCPDESSALLSDAESAAGLLRLSGEWAFRFSPDPASRPAEFFKPGFDASGWARISVPSCWELQGFGTPLYVNYTYPFKVDPPRVMGEPPASYTSFGERNPVGAYRRTFAVPESWRGRRVILHFGGVSSAYFVWVNGQRVGYAEDARLPSEFDVTEQVRPGEENLLAVEVYKYSDGSYLEDQDFWRLSGIFRDVFAYATADAALWDCYAAAGLDAAFKDGTLTAQVTLRNASAAPQSGLSLALELHGLDGRRVPLEGGPCEVALPPLATGLTAVALGPLTVRTPAAWCAETPNLYALLFVLKRDGRTVEARKRQVGFRTLGLSGGEFAVNGRRIKIKGVNRHEADPAAGYVQSRALIERDLRLIKQANFNFVRAAHYPCDPRFYEACDRLGLYVLDEANVESHGLSYHKKVLPGDRPEWQAATVARGARMALRDRGHACVALWSLGNEAGYGAAFTALRAAIRAADPEGRPIQYADMNAAADIDSQTYPTPDWLRQHLQGKAVRKGEHGERAQAEQHGPYPSGKPFLMNEYCHAMGNSLGNFQEYWDLIEANPMLIGGFIWDWVDQGLWKTRADGLRFLAYGGDFGDQPNNNNFCCNGLVGPERDPHPHYWQAAKTHQPLRAFAGRSADMLLITNKHEVLNADAYRLVWRLERDGEVVRSGETVCDIPAGEARELRLPLGREAEPDGRACVTLTLEFLLRSATAWADAGHIVAREQLLLGAQPPPAAPALAEGEPRLTPTVTESEADVRVTGPSCAFVFSRASGCLTSWSINGREQLAAPLAFNFWRAPTDNDIGGKFDHAFRTWQHAADRAVLKRLASNPERPGEVIAEFALAAGASEARLTATCRASGRLDLAAEVVCKPGADGKPLPLIPKLGMQLTLAGRHETVAWFGKGPVENYWDRQDAAWLGRHALPVGAYATSYVRPQENANRCGVRWIEFARAGGGGVRAYAEGTPLMVSAWPYSQADLEAAKHAAELPSRERLTVNLDHLQMGVGGDNSWGLPVHAAYTIPAKGTYAWRLTLLPL